MTNKEQIIIDGVEVLKEKINMCFILLLNKLETPETIEQTIYEHLDAFVKEWNAQLARKTQIIDEVEEVIKPYQEQIELDALSLPIAIESILERKTQECEELKKQLMQKSEVDMFFNTPIEGWSSNLCGICKFKNCLTEIKEIAEPFCNACQEFEPEKKGSNCMYCNYGKILQKISECEELKAYAQRQENQREEYYKEFLKLSQECVKLNNKIIDMNSIIEDAAINLGNKDFTLYDLPFEIKKLSQECENLKAEEKYLKQCCEKAGEELAKHSFEYDGKEKNLVVQAMELNEKYEKFEKALEEIEEVIDSIFDRCLWRKTDSCMPVYNVCEELIKTLDIINKAKGETNA